MFDFPKEFIRSDNRVNTSYFFSSTDYRMPKEAELYAKESKKPFPECFFPYVVDINGLAYDTALLYFNDTKTPLSEFMQYNMKNPWIYWIVNSKKCILCQSEADAARLKLYV